MSKVRNIVSSFRYEVAKATRTCDVSAKHKIMAGESHFAYEPVRGQRKNICLACAPAIIEKAKKHLEEIANGPP